VPDAGTLRRFAWGRAVVLSGPGLAARWRVSFAKTPVIEILGCRLHGLSVVCGAGPLLPRRLRKKEPYYKEEIEPSGQSAKPYSSKGGTASKTGSSHESQGASKNATDNSSSQQPATQTGSAAGVHACPPGNMVFDKPNASGSYCEPAGQNAGAAAGQSGGPTIMDKIPSPTPTGDAASSQSQTGAPASGTVPAALMPTQSGGSFCCSAPTTSNGQPTASLQACGTDQSSALTALVSAAAQKNVTLGNVQCSAH
jgi:hypothetical protein